MKNLFAMQEMQETLLQSLGQEDPLEEGMAIQSSILTWRISWRQEPGELQGCKRAGHDKSDLACKLFLDKTTK